MSASAHLIERTALWEDLNHVTWSITKMISEIGGRVLYVKHELETTFDLPEPVQTVLTALCNEIDKVNYGVSSDALRSAIEELHDAAVSYASDKTIQKAEGLEVLANGLCGDMLFHWQIGKGIHDRFRQVNAS